MYKQHRTERLLQEADGLVWGDGSDQLTVCIKKEQKGEAYHYVIRVMKTDGRIAHESGMAINHDMWGGGFVEALNADKDAEPEVVAWGAHEAKTSYFLDYSKGLVEQRPLSEASSEMKTFVRDWRAAHVTDRAGVFFLFFPLAGYYILLGLVLLIVGIRHRKKSE
jgi:hypothetical protein